MRMWAARRQLLWIPLVFLTLVSPKGSQITVPVEITLRPDVTHQTILGWGADQTASAEQMGQMLTPYPTRVFAQLYDDAVDLIGFNSIRILSHYHPPFGMWEPLNDDGDPLTEDTSKFNLAWLDVMAQRDLIPLKQRVEANGEPFHMYLSMGTIAASEIPAWLKNSPDEYAEYLFTAVRYLKAQYGLDVASVAVVNEPLFGGSDYAHPGFIARVVKVLGPRLAAAGYVTKIQFPETLNPHQAWEHQIVPLQNDDEFWSHVGLITYHKYGTPDPFRAAIRRFGQARGIPIAQTEQDGKDSTMIGLYDDMVLAGVSRWGTSFNMVGFGTDIDRGALYTVHADGHSFSRHKYFWSFRQVMKYARPGAVRIDASSSAPGVRVLAFKHKETTTAIVISAGSAFSARITNLAPGMYGVSQSVNQAESEELGIRTLSAGQVLTVDVPANTVLTVYPRAAPNRPPLVTSWTSSAPFLKLWAGETLAVLSAVATDPERYALTYAWRVVTFPKGAAVVFAAPRGSVSAVSGLTQPGEYGFAVDVSDGTHTVTREVFLRSHAVNAPPAVHNLHHRAPDVIVLPANTTGLRAGLLDIDGDSVSVMWSLVSQPGGATVVIATPRQARCEVKGMTVAGEYVFRITANDGRNTVSRDVTVTVHPPERGAISQ